jgi:hypothetical protein
MPDSHSETISSILESRARMDNLRWEMQEIKAHTRQTIFESQELMAQATKLLART